MSRNRPSPVDQGRLALAAILAGLPDGAPGSNVEQAMLGRPAAARDALVALVTDAAFALCSSGRGLLDDAAASLLGQSGTTSQSAWPFGAESFEPAVRAALGALLSDHSESAFAALEPEELGGLYEGLLATGIELAQSDSVVVSEPRPAGGAAVDRLVPVATLRPAVLRGRRRLAPPRLRVPAGRIALLDTIDRRRSGSHYTPRALTERVVRETLEPLLGDAPSGESVLALRVCDPAMGTGAFLVAVCRYLAERLLCAEHAAGVERSAPERVRARRRVAEHCLFGVDRDARAVAVARQALWLAIGDSTLPLAAFDSSLCVGEALLGPPRDGAAPHATTTPRPSRARQTSTRGAEALHAALDWERAFAHVFAVRGGFDAFVGNPPWVSYAGRAAQPLARELHLEYARYEAFRGYRNLQGLFVERCARLLRPGGRLGLVLPSSMSELAGYRPTRRAHDRWCAPDEMLADLGASAFEGVFQPCMVLRSTRRAASLEDVPERPWPVERPDLDAVAHALIEKLSRAPLPAHLFGERGLQSTGKDGAHLVAAPDARHSVPLRSGSDVEAFGLKNPSAHADPAWFGPRLRPPHEWERVRLLVRQTARVPVVALSDGVGFRNSLLAGFDDDEHPAAFLVAYLNSTPIRWLHYARHRDARQGMPQLKVAHLRATPSPPSHALKNTLTAFGKELSVRGRGIRAREQIELDELVENAFGLDEKERKRLAEFRASVADAKPRD